MDMPNTACDVWNTLPKALRAASSQSVFLQFQTNDTYHRESKKEATNKYN